MKKISLAHPTAILAGEVEIGGSKSISNRALLLCSLAGVPPEHYLTGLSPARDTQIMQRLLADLGVGHFDAEDAGTAFRFMAARLAIVPGTHVLTGSARMCERPIGALVEAIRQLGVAVEYLGVEGFPPLRIHGIAPENSTINSVTVAGNVSSQFISALAMIGCVLPNGLKIEVTEPRVSWSYVEMTLALLKRMSGAQSIDFQATQVSESVFTLQIPHIALKMSDLQIEPDWSSASYWCSMAALSKSSDLLLHGLQLEQSLQGDAAIVKHFRKLGLEFTQEPNGVRIQKKADAELARVLSIDFTQIPDTAQTIAVSCAALGVSGVFKGLETLAIKETNRILALKSELKKVGVTFARMPAHMSKKGTQYLLDGKVEVPEQLEIETYSDHRMAMAFAPLALLGTEISILDPGVVQKSYPGFWSDLERLGFQIN
jgi:3-phosphoshikimate 1-carboxyvinyltransferase